MPQKSWFYPNNPKRSWFYPNIGDDAIQGNTQGHDSILEASKVMVGTTSNVTLIEKTSEQLADHIYTTGGLSCTFSSSWSR